MSIVGSEQRAVDPVVVRTTDPVDGLITALRAERDVIVADAEFELSSRLIADLHTALRADGVGSASPVPVPSQHLPASYEIHRLSPPPPTIAVPNRRLCALCGRAASSLAGHDSLATVGEYVSALGERMTHHGWRHVAAPGVALAEDEQGVRSLHETGGWTAAAVASMMGSANAGLEAHVTWATAQFDGVRLVIDGACLTDAPFTGTQYLVVEVARWMSMVRPTASVSLAVKRSQLSSVRRRLADSSVEVIERRNDLDVDVVYRPYQMLYAAELGFVTGVGRRGVIGQLDMIGFSIAAYHPSDQLFFFARNLQRHLMRQLDAVVFISEFGKRSAIAECPDLDRERLHVVSCGADPQPLNGASSEQPPTIDGRFVVCLSSTFWHKNRAHAIATFAQMVQRHGYDGSLVITGPEPYFGSSSDEESRLLASMPSTIGSRVHHLGHVDDAVKWWLLRHADLVLYPSIVEGFGLVPFEAAAVATPSLSYAGTAPGELLAGTSAVVESWSPGTWAARAATLIGSDAARGQLVSEVTAVAASHTWERCADRTWGAVDAALASPRRSIHGEDGGSLAKITNAGGVHPLAAQLRFDVARGIPAVIRRIRRIRARRAIR